MQKLLAALFAVLMAFGGVACTVDADDDAEGGAEVEVEQTEVQEEPVESES